MPLTITGVALAGNDTYTGYTRDVPGRTELQTALTDPANWSAQSARVNEAMVGYPVVDGHPGHVDPGTSGWKYNIERGNNSVDRLYVKATATRTGNNVAIAANLSIRTDQH